jgi:DNA-binding transcriptional LysR family regulator
MPHLIQVLKHFLPHTFIVRLLPPFPQHFLQYYPHLRRDLHLSSNVIVTSASR